MKNRGPLRKDMFPRLLRQTMENVEVTQAETIKSRFKVTGLIPLNHDAVLKKLPRQDVDNTTDSATTIAATLKDLFQEARFGEKADNNTAPKTAKREKLSVPPGNSVAHSDISVTESVQKN
jgi:hypothetical protein